MEWEDRFWAKVDRKGPDECWAWLAYKNNDGYGVFGLKGKNIGAHRLVWILNHGDIPKGLIVRHKCRGKCVNPNHLELGTHADNMADLIRDGTSCRGEKHHLSSLTEQQVLIIKKRLESYEKGMVVKLASEFGVRKETISAIKTGKTWYWL